MYDNGSDNLRTISTETNSENMKVHMKSTGNVSVTIFNSFMLMYSIMDFRVKTDPGAGDGEIRPAKQSWLHHWTLAQFFSLWTLISFTVFLGAHCSPTPSQFCPWWPCCDQSPTHTGGLSSVHTHYPWILSVTSTPGLGKCPLFWPHQRSASSCSIAANLKISWVIIDTGILVL